MKLNPVKRQLNESVKPEDIGLWNEYCMDIHRVDGELYYREELPDVLDGMKPADAFWLGASSVNVWNSDYLTHVGGRFRGLSEREVKDLYLGDPGFRAWKREHGYSKSKSKK